MLPRLSAEGRRFGGDEPCPEGRRPGGAPDWDWLDARRSPPDGRRAAGLDGRRSGDALPPAEVRRAVGPASGSGLDGRRTPLATTGDWPARLLPGDGRRSLLLPPADCAEGRRAGGAPDWDWAEPRRSPGLDGRRTDWAEGRRPAADSVDGRRGALGGALGALPERTRGKEARLALAGGCEPGTGEELGLLAMESSLPIEFVLSCRVRRRPCFSALWRRPALSGRTSRPSGVR